MKKPTEREIIMMMTEELSYKVGDRVWVVFDRGNPKYMTISKSGRKWITLENSNDWRFALGSNELEEPGFGKIGKIFRSQEQWKSIVTERNAKNALINKFGLSSNSPLWNLPLDKLEAIDRILE